MVSPTQTPEYRPITPPNAPAFPENSRDVKRGIEAEEKEAQIRRDRLALDGLSMVARQPQSEETYGGSGKRVLPPEARKEGWNKLFTPTKGAQLHRAN